MVRTHEDNVRNWVFGLTGMGTAKPYTEKSMRRLVTGNRDDTLYSYGTHFPLVRLIRTRHGRPSHWLINGDTWSGGWSMTSAHQSAVRDVIGGLKETLGMPHVIVPQSVIDAAGIDPATIQIVDVSKEWWEDRVEEYDTPPEGSRWVYEKTTLPGTGVRVNQRTGEVFTHGWVGSTYHSDPPGRPQYRPIADRGKTRDQVYAEYLAELQAWETLWERIPAVEKSTGRKRLMLNGHSFQELDLYERADGTTGYRYSWKRHWLGESLIRGRISYAADVKCPTCKGTGVHPHAEAVPQAEGPMTEWQDRIWSRWNEPGSVENRYVMGSRIEERCERCEGRRRIRTMKNRWAYFLSGFDHNEPRPSYFFCELPPRVHPTTVEEAYLTLKPKTVRLAEEMGRTVLRQGDQWFVEMPGLTLRELKKQGGVHHRRGGPGLEHQQAQPAEIRFSWQIPRFQRLINMDCWLHGTTHEASEVVRVGALTYARGTVKHVPDGRAPDHVRLPLGDRKTWFLCIPNGTPTGA